MMIGLMIMASMMVVGCNTDATDNTGMTGNAVAAESEYVTIPLSGLSKDVKSYTFDDRGVEISYFAVLGSDGKPRTAFDACDVCGGYKGYQQKGSDIQCRNCGRVFSIDGLGSKNKGYGCWPSHLPHEVEGNDILIKRDDIKAGRQRFA